MDYVVRQAKMEDLERIEEIYDYARKFMAENGNPNQWGKTYPSVERLMNDIYSGNLYLITKEDHIHGVFVFIIGEDPTYCRIFDGHWHNSCTYGTIHRVAGDGSGGIFRAVMDFAGKNADYLRIDTHRDNKVMQHVIQKAGFQKCGIIYTDDGTPRIAYDLLSEETPMIREARKEDLGEILNLYLFLHETAIPQDSAHLRDMWVRIIDDPNHHLLVCEAENKIVSSCDCIIIPNLTRNVRPYAFIENVVTHREYRGKGYATACLNYARRIAEECDCYKIMLLTGVKSEKTLDFYRNAGYNSSDKTAFIQWLNM